MTTALVVVLALAAVAFVALPLLRAPAAGDVVAELTSEQRERLALREERDASLAALQDLEFDHRTGKIAEVDYLPVAAELRARVARALAALEAAGDAAGVAAAERVAPRG